MQGFKGSSFDDGSQVSEVAIGNCLDDLIILLDGLLALSPTSLPLHLYSMSTPKGWQRCRQLSMARLKYKLKRVGAIEHPCSWCRPFWTFFCGWLIHFISNFMLVHCMDGTLNKAASDVQNCLKVIFTTLLCATYLCLSL